MTIVDTNRTINRIIRDKGGITLSLRKGVLDVYVPDTGYQVAVRGIFQRDIGHPLTPEEFHRLFKEVNVETHKNGIEAFIGAWHDEETGSVDWDISLHVADPQLAITIAETADQKAVWDWANKCTYDIQTMKNLVDKEAIA